LSFRGAPERREPGIHLFPGIGPETGWIPESLAPLGFRNDESKDRAMTTRSIDVRDRKVTIAEAGEGAPLVYLHGFADVHGVAGELLPFHQKLARHARVIAPAHPGCNGSDEISPCSIDDIIFHYLELFDSELLPRFDLVGHCVGGWIAAELAARHPERVARLTLIGACGLFVPGEPIGDIFMHAQPERGTDLSSLRTLLFAEPDGAVAKRWFPDGRGDIEEELRRYQMLRFGSFMGFKPPYFYHRELRDRLYRASMPSLVLWGGHDRMVPPAHGAAYGDGLSDVTGLATLARTGHAILLEEADRAAELIREFHDQYPDEHADMPFDETIQA
jgi:pimeloyl-ACP methyl ester carboxylesterase